MDADTVSKYTINRAFATIGLPSMCYSAAVNLRERECTFYLRSGSPSLTTAQRAQLKHLIGARSLNITRAYIVGRW